MAKIMNISIEFNEIVRINVELITQFIKNIQMFSDFDQVEPFLLWLHEETGLLRIPSLKKRAGYQSIEFFFDLNEGKIWLKEEGAFDEEVRRVVVETSNLVKQFLLTGKKEFFHLSAKEVASKNFFSHFNREEAESILLKKGEEGGYLFRKDPFATCLEEILAVARRGEKIECFTLTFIHNGQVKDKTIIHRKGEWMFYDDNPKLLGYWYLSLNDLIASLGDKLKKLHVG